MSSLDTIIRGGHIVDGNGTERRRGDVGIANGRIVEIGEIGGTADVVIDAGDRIVAPGFVDVHTHLDVQGFWDPTLSPSPLHGVTTAFGGNCGFSVAPLTAHAGDYLMRMLARVEGMPLASLQQGVPWDWQSTGEFLDRLEGRLSINTGFMVGHSAMRRVVMGEAATQRTANEAELAAMQDLLRAGLAAGGLGFSSSWGIAHLDGEGVPIPSSHADHDEMVALAAVCREFEGTQLEFIPPNSRVPFDDHVMELMADMSAAARRTLNWNLLIPALSTVETCQHNLGGYDLAQSRGGHVIALTIPFFDSLRFTLHTGFTIERLPGWSGVMALPVEEKLRVFANPDRRRELDALAQQPSPEHDLLADWGKHYIFDTHTPETERYARRFVQDVADELGKDAFDALMDICVADGLRTGFGRLATKQTREQLEGSRSIWTDPRSIIGGSDAGAHVDMVATFNMATTLLERCRTFDLMPLEEVVMRLTAIPADLYGVRDRGRLAEGAHADVVIFDEHTIGSEPTTTRFDLPGGAGRLYAGATGIHDVLVNGTVVASDGAFTDARPGRVLRSGRDTATSFPG